jgi:hypothetical protein
VSELSRANVEILERDTFVDTATVRSATGLRAFPDVGHVASEIAHGVVGSVRIYALFGVREFRSWHTRRSSRRRFDSTRCRGSVRRGVRAGRHAFLLSWLISHLAQSVHVQVAPRAHFVPAMCLKRAPTSINADSPSGKFPTTRVRRRISLMIRSSMLFVRNLTQCSRGKAI